MATTSDPASVGVVACGAACSAAVLFGELDEASGIEALEVQYGGEWHRHAVSGSGYIVRLDDFTGVPDGYRWLDAAGALVWSSGRVATLEY